MKKMGRIKKIILISAVSFLALYGVGGTIAGMIVPNLTMNGRGIDPKDSLTARQFKLREDFPLLAEPKDYSFTSGGNTLVGHFYEAESPRGTAIFAHGMNSSSGGPEAVIEDYLLQEGYDVFAIDLTAHGESEGNTKISLRQSAFDVEAAYACLLKENQLSDNVLLAGYSWGGYGVAEAAATIQPNKLLTFSAYDCAYEEMLESSVELAGPIMYATVPTFALATVITHGQKDFDKASSHVPEETRVFAVQGKQDTRVPLSISFAKGIENRRNSRVFYLDATHMIPWISASAREYVDSLKEGLSAAKKASKEEQDAFISSVDKEKSSALDAALVEELNDFLSE